MLYYDTMPDGSPIPLDVSQINVALQAVRDGSLTPKHSENMAERFARVSLTLFPSSHAKARLYSG